MRLNSYQSFCRFKVYFELLWSSCVVHQGLPVVLHVESKAYIWESKQELVGGIFCFLNTGLTFSQFISTDACTRSIRADFFWKSCSGDLIHSFTSENVDLVLWKFSKGTSCPKCPRRTGACDVSCRYSSTAVVRGLFFYNCSNFQKSGLSVGKTRAAGLRYLSWASLMPPRGLFWEHWTTF